MEPLIVCSEIFYISKYFKKSRIQFSRISKYISSNNLINSNNNYQRYRYKYNYNYNDKDKFSKQKVSYKIAKDADYALKTKLFNPIENNNIVGVYVHGSWADNTRTSFSDFDDLIIINRCNLSYKSKRQIEQWLNSVDMKFCRLDPLQHHGHWIIYKDQLANFDESIISLVVLNNALRVCGSTLIDAHININTTKFGLQNNIENTIKNIKRYYSKYIHGNINIYEMKCLIGSFLIAPAFIFQINGNRICKRTAIESSSEFFCRESQVLIKIASIIRKEWDIVLNRSGYKKFTVASKIFTNPNLYRLFAKNYSPLFPKSKFELIPSDYVKRFVLDARRALL